jgi:NADH:ubiquinone oxidoreductase subunit 4 (subunit M)
MKLQINEHPIDRVVRIVLAVALFTVVATGSVGAPWLYLAGFVGAIMLVTGAVGFCPLYAILRVSTLPSRR